MWSSSLRGFGEFQTKTSVVWRHHVRRTAGLRCFKAAQVNSDVSHWNTVTWLVPESQSSTYDVQCCTSMCERLCESAYCTSCLINYLFFFRSQRPTRSKRTVSFQVHSDLIFFSCYASWHLRIASIFQLSRDWARLAHVLIKKDARVLRSHLVERGFMFGESRFGALQVVISSIRGLCWSDEGQHMTLTL